MKLTKELPTVPGYYWFRQIETGIEQICEVDQFVIGLSGLVVRYRNSIEQLWRYKDEWEFSESPLTLEEPDQDRIDAAIQEKLKDFQTKVEEAAKKAISEGFIDYLPYARIDYEMNVGHYVDREIKQFLAGWPSRILKLAFNDESEFWIKI